MEAISPNAAALRAWLGEGFLVDGVIKVVAHERGKNHGKSERLRSQAVFCGNWLSRKLTASPALDPPETSGPRSNNIAPGPAS